METNKALPVKTWFIHDKLNSFKMRGAYKRTKVVAAMNKGGETYADYCKENGVVIAQFENDYANELFYVVNGIVARICYIEGNIDSYAIALKIPEILFTLKPKEGQNIINNSFLRLI